MRLAKSCLATSPRSQQRAGCLFGAGVPGPYRPAIEFGSRDDAFGVRERSAEDAEYRKVAVRSSILGPMVSSLVDEDSSRPESGGVAARCNADDLVARVERLAPYAFRIEVVQRDGIEVIADALGQGQSFIYADPPHLSAGDDLYLNALERDDHVRLAEELRGGGQWLLTYDADPRVTSKLYPSLRCASFDFAHTASKANIGTEYAVFSSDLLVPSIEGLGRTGGLMLRLDAARRHTRCASPEVLSTLVSWRNRATFLRPPRSRSSSARP